MWGFGFGECGGCGVVFFGLGWVGLGVGVGVGGLCFWFVVCFVSVWWSEGWNFLWF